MSVKKEGGGGKGGDREKETPFPGGGEKKAKPKKVGEKEADKNYWAEGGKGSIGERIEVPGMQDYREGERTAVQERPAKNRKGRKCLQRGGKKGGRSRNLYRLPSNQITGAGKGPEDLKLWPGGR